MEDDDGIARRFAVTLTGVDRWSAQTQRTRLRLCPPAPPIAAALSRCCRHCARTPGFVGGLTQDPMEEGVDSDLRCGKVRLLT
jgi:hypothetical protein